MNPGPPGTNRHIRLLYNITYTGVKYPLLLLGISKNGYGEKNRTNIIAKKLPPTVIPAKGSVDLIPRDRLSKNNPSNSQTKKIKTK
jgi:hypothetical protein